MAKHHMDPQERAEYDRYMGEGISELRRLWHDGLDTLEEAPELVNPGGTLGTVLDVALLGGLAIGAYAFGPKVWSALKSVHAGASGQTVTPALPPAGPASAPPAGACSAGSYRRADGQVVTLATIKAGLQGAGYGGPFDTASMVAAYSRSQPDGGSVLTACA